MCEAGSQVGLVDGGGRLPVCVDPPPVNALQRPSPPWTGFATTTWLCRCGSRLRLTPCVNAAPANPVVAMTVLSPPIASCRSP